MLHVSIRRAQSGGRIRVLNTGSWLSYEPSESRAGRLRITGAWYSTQAANMKASARRRRYECLDAACAADSETIFVYFHLYKHRLAAQKHRDTKRHITYIIDDTAKGYMQTYFLTFQPEDRL